MKGKAISRVVVGLRGLTAIVLVGLVAVRMVQDLPLVTQGGALSDPVVAALMAVEVVPLVVGLVLGISAGAIAWRGWKGAPQTSMPATIVFVLVAAGALLLGLRGAGENATAGWTLALLSAAALTVDLGAALLTRVTGDPA